MMESRAQSVELALACVWHARDRAERARNVLNDFGAPAHLIDALERSRVELSETSERLAERVSAAREAA